MDVFKSRFLSRWLALSWQSLVAHCPGSCAVCRSWAATGLCDECVRVYADPQWRCPGCAVPMAAANRLCGRCLVVPPPFESAFAALDYAAPWRDLIHQLKFNQALQLVPSLADLMSQRLIQSIDIDSSILLLPVPSSAQRLRQRGFNPAWELTRHLGLKLGVSAFARALVRIQDAPAQSSLDVTQRAANVRGAFAVHPDWRGRINGQSVVLVDDVMTSMATLSELTRVVQQAGAAHVHVWVLARATLH